MFGRRATVAGMLAGTAAAVPFGRASAQTLTFQLQSVFPLTLPSIGPSPQLWAERVAQMTNGRVRIQVHGAGTFVPPFEVFGAVSSGALDMGFDWIGYWANQIPVANLVGSMPFGPSPDTFLAWMFRGGGLEIIQRAYDRHNVVVLPCHLVVAEAGGWFNREIRAVEDLRGLNMRIAGLGGLAMARLGANTQLIPAAEIFVSLERGRIDAAEFSTPQLDLGLGLQRIARFYYFPGWHQPASWDSIIINRRVWDRLGPDIQRILREAAYAHITFNLIDQLHAQAEALERIRAAGVQIRRFPESVLQALRDASQAVMDEEARRDASFAEALTSLRGYISRVGEWETLQALSRL